MELADKPGFALAVMEMRGGLEKSNRYPHSFKLARGGFYDIDFLASYLVLRSPSLVPGNTIDRLSHLAEMGVLDHAICEELLQAAVLYRTVDHLIRRVTVSDRPELPEDEHARSTIEKLVICILMRY